MLLKKKFILCEAIYYHEELKYIANLEKQPLFKIICDFSKLTISYALESLTVNRKLSMFHALQVTAKLKKRDTCL